MVNKNNDRPIAVKVSGVEKMYRLGQIGGGTLQADLQSWWAKFRGREDPNTKIGANQRLNGMTFMALNGVDLTIYQGEAVGIIGQNGAGKSTLLKLLSRITAPTTGVIDIYGRIASMLEVGTGFNLEMTGRENVYLNGAILGMTKEEIDRKMEAIIDFSEVRDFIDTPVKRYSSGMFVKLAFSVAAHLDSEILIMDEVLAVGDMAFQKKCINKMKETASQDGRTVLYVSHNMSTIRNLCDRCIVLDKGKVVFEGDVESAISIYLGTSSEHENYYVYGREHHQHRYCTDDFVMNSMQIYGEHGNRFMQGEKIRGDVNIVVRKPYKDIFFRTIVTSSEGIIMGSMLSSSSVDFDKPGEYTVSIEMDTTHLMKGNYKIDVNTYTCDKSGSDALIDGVYPGFFIEIVEEISEKQPLIWLNQYWGNAMFHDLKINMKSS